MIFFSLIFSLLNCVFINSRLDNLKDIFQLLFLKFYHMHLYIYIFSIFLVRRGGLFVCLNKLVIIHIYCKLFFFLFAIIVLISKKIKLGILFSERIFNVTGLYQAKEHWHSEATSGTIECTKDRSVGKVQTSSRQPILPVFMPKMWPVQTALKFMMKTSCHMLLVAFIFLFLKIRISFCDCHSR